MYSMVWYSMVVVYSQHSRAQLLLLRLLIASNGKCTICFLRLYEQLQVVCKVLGTGIVGNVIVNLTFQSTQRFISNNVYDSQTSKGHFLGKTWIRSDMLYLYTFQALLFITMTCWSSMWSPFIVNPHLSQAFLCDIVMWVEHDALMVKLCNY